VSTDHDYPNLFVLLRIRLKAKRKKSNRKKCKGKKLHKNDLADCKIVVMKIKHITEIFPNEISSNKTNPLLNDLFK
jgi:hypothetical protein